MNTSQVIGLTIISLLGAISPGPSIILVINNSIKSGRMHGIFTAWAHAFGIGVYATATILGASALIDRNPLLYTGISVMGALYLLKSSINLFMIKTTTLSSITSNPKKPQSLSSAITDGLAMTFLNPKIIIYFTVVFSPIITTSHAIKDSVIMVLIPFLIDGFYYTLVSASITSTSGIRFVEKYNSILNRSFALILFSLSLMVIYQAIKR